MRRFRFAQTLVVEVGGRELSAWVAGSFGQRLLGLAGVRAMPPDTGLLIPECASVHTWGMRFAIDVAFLEWPPHAGSEVIRLWEGVEPRRWARLRGRPARHTAVLEVPAGTLRELGAGAVLPAVTFNACPQGT